MKRLLAAAALAAALSCSAAGTQDIQKHGEEYFRIFSILPDGQGILARRCTKLTQSGLCVGAPVLLPADAVKAPAEEKVCASPIRRRTAGTRSSMTTGRRRPS